MSIEIREEPMTGLDQHGRISIAFEVRSVLHVEARDNGVGGLALLERAVTEPWIKDYDVDADETPAHLASRFDLGNWGLVSAWDGATRVGGAVIAFDTPGVRMLEGRRDLAVLWDIRIVSSWRGRGVGTMLFQAVGDWARSRGCVRLDVETQNINVPACRFYAGMGCELRRIDRFAYASLPDEAQLLWAKRLR
jgi:GNAT superfamily N-acetyltransferase